jgi:uncharacterized protein YkwD
MSFSLSPLQVSLLLGSIAALAPLAGCGGDNGGSGGSGGSTVTLPYPALQDAPYPSPSKAWSHGDPSDLEQQLLELVQRARANPPGEVDLMLAVPGVKSAMQQFQVSETQLRNDFNVIKPVAPLSFDVHLMASSKFHSDDMATNGFQEHNGSAGESFDQRITTAGYKWSFVSENIFAHATSVPYCHAAFLVDWGNPDPGHRKAILDIDGPKRDIGISIVEKPSSPKVGPLVVTQDFGAPAGSPPDAQVYIVGVAYTDDNGNGAYDPGEGKADLHVIPSAGNYEAVTSKSGGFSVPMSGKAGMITVQLQLEQDGVRYVVGEQDVTINGHNVKADFVLKPTGDTTTTSTSTN